jgi:hypothetical protein
VLDGKNLPNFFLPTNRIIFGFPYHYLACQLGNHEFSLLKPNDVHGFQLNVIQTKTAPQASLVVLDEFQGGV